MKKKPTIKDLKKRKCPKKYQCPYCAYKMSRPLLTPNK